MTQSLTLNDDVNGKNDDCDDEDDVDDDLKSEQNILSPFLLPLNLNESNRSPRRTEIKECEVRSTKPQT